MNTETKQLNAPRPDSSSHPKILRFRKSERLLHWALAIPFMVCLGSALVLVVHYNPDPTRPYRAVFAATHRIAGIAFIVLPVLVALIKGDFRIHFYNIRQAWIWTFEDIKWLSLMGLAAVIKKISLPEQGKFNAAEKLNFMYLMATYSFYVLSGFLIWMTDVAFLAWIVHCAIATLAIPLILGHIYMATVNAGSRTGLSGMFSGYVCRHWAKHHYTKWYKEHFADDHQPASVTPGVAGNKSQPSLQATSDTPEETRDAHEVAMGILDRLDHEALAAPDFNSQVLRSAEKGRNPSHKPGPVPIPAGVNTSQKRKIVARTPGRDPLPTRSVAEGTGSSVLPLTQRRSA